MKRLSLTIAFVLVAPLAAFAEAPIDAALQHVPNNAALVVIIPDVGQLADHVSAFGKSSGIDALSTIHSADVFGKLFEGHVDGLDPNGACIVAMRPGWVYPIIVSTLSDSDTWKPKAGAEGLAEGFVPFHVDSKTWYGTRFGHVGMCTRVYADLRDAMANSAGFADRMTSDCRKMLANHQVVVWADVPAWSDVLEGALTVGQGTMHLMTAMSDPDAQGTIAMWRSIFDDARTLVRESQVYMGGLRFSADGVFGEDLLKVRPGGKIADYLGAVDKTSADPLRGLTGEPGMFTLGLEWRIPQGTASLNESMLDALVNTAQGRQLLQKDGNQEGFDAVKRFYQRVTGYSASVSAADSGRIGVTGLYVSAEPKAAFKDFKLAADTWMKPGWMRLMTSRITMKASHEMQHVGDVNADVYTFAFGSQDEQTKKIMDMMYGESMKFYVAPHKQGVAFAMGPGDFAADAFSYLYDAKAKTLAESPRITAARRTIAPNPQVCMFFDPPKMAYFFMDKARELGQPGPSVTPPKGDAPLVAYGFYLESTAMRCEMFVPAESISRINEVWGHPGDSMATR